ncbi:mitochondrial succinate dehydrogenase complex subunit C [Pelomyxa schiedti]|nr:mitochondrial succinate dehydrogenase complex subunit C [Pelomyxa schiedti]
MEVIGAFGIGTPRYNTGLCVADRPFEVDVSMGPCVARWDVRARRRVFLVQAHMNAVTSVLRCPAPVCPTRGAPDNSVSVPSSAVSGKGSDDPAIGKREIVSTTSCANEIGLWTTDWQPLFKTTSQFDGIMHSSWNPSGSHFLVLCEPGEALEIFALGKDGASLSSLCTIRGRYEYAELNSSNDIICFMDKQYYVPAVAPQLASIPEGDFCVMRVLHPSLASTTPYSVVKDTPFLGKSGWTSIVSGGGTIAALQNRSVVLINRDSCDVTHMFDLPGSGIPKGMILDGDTFIYPSSDGTMRCNRGPSTEWSLKLPSGDLYSATWSVPYSRMWYLTDSNLWSIDIAARLKGAKPVEYSMSYHDTVCCGIAFHPQRNCVAVGDFGGSIWIWAFSEDKSAHECLRVVSNMLLPIRALSWSIDGSIQCATMDGVVWHWENPFQEGDEPKPVARFMDAITALSWENGDSPKQLGVACSDGTLAILYFSEGFFKIRVAFKAHKPSTKPQDLQFGSLTKYAEIWSIAWSPNNNFIASSSEDQQTCIWDMNMEKIAVLSGHKTAVTSVKWVRTPAGEFLATCADDKTVMIWVVRNSSATPEFTLHHVFNTSEVLAWHTVTYLCIQQAGPATDNNHYVSCVTQNGWLFLWDLVTKRKLGPFRLHLGSIEGLAWDPRTGLIATCSSDTCVVVTRVLGL